MTISSQSIVVQLSLAYAIPGLIAAVVASFARWYFPIVASSASTGEHVPSARRVRRFESIGKGFAALEAVLVVLGTFAELLILISNTENFAQHVTLLCVYGLLWLSLLLYGQKRSIIGRVVTPRQQPVHGAIVRAVHEKDHLHEATTTDEDGKFRLKVHPGDYQLTATQTDHEPAHTAIATHSKNATRISMVAKPKQDQERMTSPERR